MSILPQRTHSSPSSYVDSFRFSLSLFLSLFLFLSLSRYRQLFSSVKILFIPFRVLVLALQRQRLCSLSLIYFLHILPRYIACVCLEEFEVFLWPVQVLAYQELAIGIAATIGPVGGSILYSQLQFFFTYLGIQFIYFSFYLNPLFLTL